MKRFAQTAAAVLGGISVCFMCSCFKPTPTNVWSGSSQVIHNSHSEESSSSSSSSSSSLSSSTYSSSTSFSSPQSSSIPETSQTESSATPSEPEEPQGADSERYNELLAEYLADPDKVKQLEIKLSENALFVGDSICKGYSMFGIVNANSVFADGTIGARNLLEREVFWYGKRCHFTDALEKTSPKRIYFSMGMNDVNMTTSEEYAENYKTLIDLTLNSTDADIVVFAITPVTVKSNFTSNTRIDEFNKSLSDMIKANYTERVHFVNYAYMFKNSNNSLMARLDNGDGIHLTPESYHMAMMEVGEKLGASL